MQLAAGRESRGGLPCLFFKTEKNIALILEKNALTVFIYVLNFSFKMLF